MNRQDIDTVAERAAWLAERAADRPKHKGARELHDAHIARLRLIYAPFPQVRRLGTGSALPWAGTIVTDTFFGTGDKPRGKYGAGGADGLSNSVDDDTVYGALYRDALRSYEEVA